MDAVDGCEVQGGGVSSVGNPRGPLTGFNLKRVAAAHSFKLHDIYSEVCKWLTKC